VPAADPKRLIPTVHGLMQRHSRERPATPFAEDARSGRTVTYRQLERAARAWSGWLDHHEAAVGDTVLVDIDDPLDFAVAYLGIISSGRCCAPIDPNAPSAELQRTIRTTGPVLIVSDRPARADSAAIAFLRVDGGCPPAAPEGAADYAGGSVRLSTSGSTGEPKVVHLTEAQLLHVAHNIAAHNELTESDRGYNCLPLFHINAQVVGLLSTLVAGATLVLDRRFHRTGFWPLVAAHQVTWINAVPAILAILSHDPPTPLPGLRFVRSASAPLPTAIREVIERALGVPVIESYGMTEAASQITATPLHAPRRAGSAGVAVGVEVEVRSESAGVGAVWIRGAGVIAGYANGRSAERFDGGGWLNTGDLGYLDDDGYLYLVGRNDDVINRGGELIYPREVEEVLLDDPRVIEAVVIGRPHDIFGAVPVAYVLTESDGESGLADDLERRCLEQLSPFKRPVAIQLVDELPRAATGKIRRHDLRELVAASSTS
jgi:acyl-CoA synthetase (AMP-forming)/AMP-acid ligase II